MKIFYIFVLVYTCLYPLCTSQTVRPNCDLNTCNRTIVEICATNGQYCKRFSSECSLQRENCNATLSTAWNRTDTIQCLNLRSNASALCACPALRTCSNRPAPSTGICVHGVEGGCRLYRTECDLARARCNGEVWHNVDASQCRGFNISQTRKCTCPKTLQCSRNQTQLCVQVDANSCRLYGNECDLEAARCRGERLVDINNVQCRRFRLGETRACLCPALLSCQQNVTNICVRNEQRRCQLVRNECDLEQKRCEGSVLTSDLPIQCHSLRPGETGTCACPLLDTCSVNRTNICVQTRIGCRLKRNECELEQSRCQGVVMKRVHGSQCLGFQPGEGKPCACPNLLTCSRNNTNICVKSILDAGCILMRNECEVEQKKCEGRKFAIVDSKHCRNFTVNQMTNCTCTSIASCGINSPNICTTTSTSQCKLFQNQCEVEKARCVGEVLSTINPLQCRGLPLNTTRNCFCPGLRNCSRNSSAICVRENTNNSSCLLLRNDCELAQAICEGKDLTRVDGIYCRNFTLNTSNACYCPNLRTCNRNSSSICVMNSSQCRLMGNECELEQAKCEGQNLIKTHASQCLNFQINQQRNCSCPNLFTCSQNSTKICVRTRRGCKLFTTQCALEEAKCRGEVIRTVDAIHCQGFPSQQEYSCFCPNLETCSRNETKICLRSPQNNCTLLKNECQLEEAKCQGQGHTILPNFQCKDFNFGVLKKCVCPNLFNCSTQPTSICLKTTTGCTLLRNQCELEHYKCQGNVVRTISLQHCMGFQFGQTRNCSCPNLETCSLTNTNICVKNATGCTLIPNECELEQLKCRGANLTVLPAIQCKLLHSNNEGTCACPNWLNCQQNSTNVCVETLRGCRLLKNQCDLEQLKCQGEALNITNILQCQGFRVGQVRNCACPELKTCSLSNSTNICVKNEKGCKRMANSCDLELAKCKGEKWCSQDSVQCQNFSIGHQRKCTCPSMETCAQNNRTNICVNLKGACKLMKNHCELEKAKCKGQAWSPTLSIQCQNYKPNEWRWCACPRLLNCCNMEKQFCVKGPQGCKLMKTDCELQMARCKGEVWFKADDLECKGFVLGQPIRTCTCPKLATCHQNTTSIADTQVCVRNTKGCKLFRNDCQLERSLCSGEVWQPVESIQCQNFPLLETRSCHCPSLETCSNETRVCGRTPTNQCYHFKSECDMIWSQCEGQKLSLTLLERCEGFSLGSSDDCRCPELWGCNRRQQVCGRKGQECKYFSNDCDYRHSTCLNRNWQRTSLAHCCQFQSDEVKNCTLSMATAVCGMISNQCRLFASRCELNIVNLSARRKWRVVDRINCQCMATGRTAKCAQRPICMPANSPKVCGRYGRTVMLFNSLCHLKKYNFRRCTYFRAIHASKCRN